MNKKCDILSKSKLFPNNCVVTNSHIKLRLDTSSDFETFSRKYVDFNKIKSSLELSLSEYTYFKGFFNIDKNISRFGFKRKVIKKFQFQNLVTVFVIKGSF